MPVVQIVGALVAIAVVAVLANARLGVPPGIKQVANVVLALLLAGIVLWLINTYVPMAESIKAIVNIVVVVASCVGVLREAGVWGEVIAVWYRFTRHTSH